MFVLRKTITLIGLMGAGKTTIGRRLAKELGVKFVDSDDEISKAAGCSIADIFELHGEEIFRDLEQRVMQRLLDEKQPFVLATGGGAWMNDDVRKSIKEQSYSVWLKAELSVLLERVSRRNHRPLLEAGDKEAILAKLIDERYPVYEKADIHIESGDGAHSKIVDEVVKSVEEHQAKNAS